MVHALLLVHVLFKKGAWHLGRLCLRAYACRMRVRVQVAMRVRVQVAMRVHSVSQPWVCTGSGSPPASCLMPPISYLLSPISYFLSPVCVQWRECGVGVGHDLNNLPGQQALYRVKRGAQMVVERRAVACERGAPILGLEHGLARESHSFPGFMRVHLPRRNAHGTN